MKTYPLASVAVAAMLVFGASPGYSATKDGTVLAQQQVEPADAGKTSPEQPSAGEDAAPVTAPESGDAPQEGQSSPAAEGAGDAAAPAQDNEAPPSDAGVSPAPDNAGPATGDDKAASPEGGSADVAPVTPENPPTPAEPGASEGSSSQSSTIDASQLKIGQAVLGSDGAKIGEVNGVKSDTAGKVQEILVTAGGAAGINAKVFAVSGDKITEVKDDVKLSLTSEEAKQLPIIDNSNG
ncbi:hypothetical protein HYPDE_30858 [Hyphomicrobium denitrificans 1NES1]|uniref:PRC-barrel domain-containing protein n=1 Tax=Hyphomicrobium denitrificans 1NES1 TaxID=670307 RepID=N0BBD5_9HYPH|nr:hypothetical protein HYPDE_30858 [Hyphomicrobium denitrificans 1NES1]